MLLAPGAGEAYDKVARLLGVELSPSGGAAVEALAREGDAQRFKFSTPLRRKPNCNFSYAGLKTAVRLAIEAEVPGPPSDANRQVAPYQITRYGIFVISRCSCSRVTPCFSLFVRSWWWVHACLEVSSCRG